METLNKLKLNETGKVVKLTHDRHMKRRLLDLGVVENAEIKRLLTAPGGDPTVYLICGAMIALRNADAEKIIVRR